MAEIKAKNRQDKQRYIRVNGQPVPVTEEVYKAYYKMGRHERYLEEKDAAHGLVHYAALDTAHSTGEEKLPDWDSDRVEDVAIRNVMAEKLRFVLDRLDADERALIDALFYDNKTERQYARETGIPQKTINNRKARILAKLKKIMEN